jgi:beta-galactosidase
MYDYAISPLDIGLVAVAPTAAFMDNDSIKPVLCDVKIGSGEIIFSQISATKRINEDSVARKYLKNVMTYFLTPGVARYALTIPDTGFSKITYVEDKDAFFIDLSKFANQGFTDDIEGDGKGGWADFGTGFKEIPAGVSRLQGGVPFKIIDPAKNNGKSCIVIKSKKRSNFPEKITGIPVNETLNSIFVLHTAMYAGKGAVLKYVIHYANGETREFTATNEQEIPDWWGPKDRLNATVVFRSGERGLYMSEFINPLPKEKIVSMDIVSCNNSTPFIIGITGRKRFTSTVAGVGEK